MSLITKPVTASITTDASDAGIIFIINTERTDSMGKVRSVCLEKSTILNAPEGHINRERNRGHSESTGNA